MGGDDSIAPRAPRQSGSDRFDEAVVTTPVQTVVALGACLLLAAGVVTWASLASIERTITAVSVAVTGGAFERVITPVAGVVASTPVDVDTTVSAGTEVAQITATDGRSYSLTAPVSGRVQNSPFVTGTAVSQGDPVVTLEPTTGARQIRMFLRPIDGEQVGVGTRAVVRFPGRDDIDGRVSSVSLLPLTRAQVVTLLGSQALAQLVAENDPVVSVTVTPDAGAALPVVTDESEGGRVANTSLIVGRTHPIDYVL